MGAGDSYPFNGIADLNCENGLWNHRSDIPRAVDLPRCVGVIRKFDLCELRRRQPIGTRAKT